MHTTDTQRTADLLPRIEAAAHQAGEIALACFRPGERTSAAIIVLLAFLLAMNGLAIYLRNRFETRW